MGRTRSQGQYTRVFLVAYIAVLLAPSRSAMGQSTNQQVWVDATLAKTLVDWRMEGELGYRTVVGAGQPWTSFLFIPRVNRNLGPHWDVVFDLFAIHSEQNSQINTWEVRPRLGVRYVFTPFGRVQTGLLLRQEERFQYVVEPTRSKQVSARTRLRAEVNVPLDVKNHFADTMWYALADIEAFFAWDDQVDERFANRYRARIGVGRKFNYNWRAELVYNFQRSRRSISDDDPTSDSILRLRIKYFFNRPRNVNSGPSQE